MSDEPSTAEFRRFLKGLYRSRLGEALDLDSTEDLMRYQVLLDGGRDPVRRLDEALDQTDVQGLALVAGVRGVGRTTGLRELARRRQSLGDLVVHVDLQERLPVGQPLGVLEVMAALVGGIDDSLQEGLPSAERESWGTWSRLGSLLPDEICRGSSDRGKLVRDLLAQTDPGLPPLRHLLAGVADEVRVILTERHDELLAQVRGLHTSRTRLVVLAQGLERLGPPVSAEASPLGAGTLVRILLTSGHLLALPETQVVLTVPVLTWWVREALEATVPLCSVHWWPALPVLGRDGTVHRPTVERLEHLIARRGDWSRVLGGPEQVEALILASGGVVRELMLLLREVVLAALREANGRVVERARASRRQAYQAMLPAGSAGALDEVRKTRRIDTLAEAVSLLPLLQDGLVVGYPDDEGGQPWFDAHPLLDRGSAPRGSP